MDIEEAIKETWFIIVLSIIGALILALVIVIIVLCCVWHRRKKREKEREQEADRKSSTPSSYQEMPDALQNWTLVHKNGIDSVPASADTSRYINGDDPNIAGKSIIQMNQEMQKNGSEQTSYTQIETRTQTREKTEVEKTLQQNTNVDAFERKISDTSDSGRGALRGAAASPTRFDRTSGIRESQQKYRITNVHISQPIQDPQLRASFPSSNRIHLPERSESVRATNTTVYNQSTQPFRMPKEDYPGYEMLSKESQKNTISRLLSDGKVKNLTEKFETTEVVNTSSAAIQSRNAQETELREQIAGRRGNKRPESFPMSPQRRISEEYSVQQDYQGRGGQVNNWQGKTSSKGTIETRVNRIKKLGAVSVFPD